jgi:hypothetical protein
VSEAHQKGRDSAIRWSDLTRHKKLATTALAIAWGAATAFGGWAWRDYDKQKTVVAVNTGKIEKIEAITTGHTGQLDKIEDKTNRILFILAGDRTASAPATSPRHSLTINPSLIDVTMEGVR